MKALRREFRDIRARERGERFVRGFVRQMRQMTNVGRSRISRKLSSLAPRMGVATRDPAPMRGYLHANNTLAAKLKHREYVLTDHDSSP